MKKVIACGLTSLAIANVAWASDKVLEHDPLLTDGTSLAVDASDSSHADLLRNPKLQELLDEHFFDGVVLAAAPTYSGSLIEATDPASNQPGEMLSFIAIADYAVAMEETDSGLAQESEKSESNGEKTTQRSRIGWTSPWVGSFREDELARTQLSIHEHATIGQEINDAVRYRLELARD